MTYQVFATEEFSRIIKKLEKQQDLLNALNSKIKRLQEGPFAVGKQLRGPLKQLYSTRLTAKFRLLFSIDEKQKIVYLKTIGHRKNVYN